jgi:SAM-dependent methyltransferase
LPRRCAISCECTDVSNYFDEPVARTYDADEPDSFAPRVVEPMVNFLHSLCVNGSACEFGIGTGRVALPLHERGVAVHGIDLSAALVNELRSMPSGHDTPVVIGDFSHTRIDSNFDLVYLVFNTVMNLTTQARQVDCFLNAARHLRDGGHFVVEVMVPDLQRVPPGTALRSWSLSESAMSVDEYDVVTQGRVSHHSRRRHDTWSRRSIPFRYVGPSDLDRMARVANSQFVDRWGDWFGSPFLATSPSHVSAWQKATRRDGRDA